MKFFDATKLSLQNLARAKFRSFLTILGVMIGISAIVSFVSLGIGLQKITTEQITSFSALTTLTVSQTPATTSMEAGPAIDDQFIQKVKNINGVKSATESINLPTSIEVGGTSAGAIVYGIKPANANLEISGLSLGKTLQKANEAVISSALANSFSPNHEDILQKEITVNITKNSEGLDYGSNKLKYIIVGIDDNLTTSMVYVPIEKLYQTGGFKNYSTLKVQVINGKSIDSVKNNIKGLGYQVTTIEDLIDQIDKIFLIVQIILGIIGGIGLLVSSLGIINTMTISFLERTREIGIMKAIGATRRDIKKLFLFESIIIGFLGGVGGVGVSIIFSTIINTTINFIIKNSGQRIDLFITPINFSIIMVGVAILISVMAGIYPTWRVQKLSPIDAIRQ